MIRPPLISGGYVAAPVKAWVFQAHIQIISGTREISPEPYQDVRIRASQSPLLSLFLLPKGWRLFWFRVLAETK
jgi:hypothetical protein